MFCNFQYFEVIQYRKGEDPKPVTTTSKQNKKVMVWGGISRKDKTSLHIYRLDKKEKVNKDTYMNCLDQNLKDCMDRKYGERKWRFLQDNARPHVAKDTQEFLQDQDIRLIEHPVYSPDLNPIEQVWAWMKQEITKRSYDAVEELISVVEDKWDDLTIEYQNKVIDHHCVAVARVLSNSGAY